MKIVDQKQPKLIRALMHEDAYDHPVKSIQLIETHISWVILTGDYAYKIKKPCNLGFLDFSTLQKRYFFCNEELRLNQKLAAPIYLNLVTITGKTTHPVLNGSGEIIEYALKMVQFSQHAQFDNMLTNGKVRGKHIDSFAHLLAHFHQSTEIAMPDTRFGTPDHIYHSVVKTIQKLSSCLATIQHDQQLSELETWVSSTFTTYKHLFEKRKQRGFIRECHGDLHLRNLLWLNDKPLAFDCLEFDPDLRWIDTLSDIAFLVMDLLYKKQPRLAFRFLNIYLEQCGDYSGLPVFRFYLVYRAIIRAMVNGVSAQQAISRPKKLSLENECFAYLALALFLAHHERSAIIIMHGMSASGKSTISQQITECLGAIRIRSDIERKRMFGLFGNSNMSSRLTAVHVKPNKPVGKSNIYSREADIQTYTKLKTLTKNIIDAGFSVIIDATFLKHEERQAFYNLASSKHIPFIILSVTASANALRQRVRKRKQDISDANISVLEHQLATSKPLHNDELYHQIIIDTEKNLDLEELVSKITQKMIR